jgi:transcriptional regulator with XRE-family HTH domain
MATKSQHNMKYRVLPPFLRKMREQAGLTQREIGKILNKPQSYVYNCETANRRVDITEFVAWSEACGVSPKTAFSQLLKLLE